MSKAKTGSRNGFRIITETGEREPARQQAKMKCQMFQCLKTKKGGRRK